MKINEEILVAVGGNMLPAYNEIPDVGLYLEQASKFINGYLEPVMGAAVTGSMISNYVKKKLVPNPVKKQYYRDQIAELMMIAVLKSVLSLDKVQVLMNMKRDEAEVQSYYGDFAADFQRELRMVFGLETADGDTAEASIFNRVLTTAAYKIYIDSSLNVC